MPISDSKTRKYWRCSPMTFWGLGFVQVETCLGKSIKLGEEPLNLPWFPANVFGLSRFLDLFHFTHVLFLKWSKQKDWTTHLSTEIKKHSIPKNHATILPSSSIPSHLAAPVSTRNRAGWGVCLCTAMPPRVTQKLLPRNWPIWLTSQIVKNEKKGRKQLKTTTVLFQKLFLWETNSKHPTSNSKHPTSMILKFPHFLPKTNTSHLKIGRNPKGNSSSNHHFSGAMLVLGGL